MNLRLTAPVAGAVLLCLANAAAKADVAAVKLPDSGTRPQAVVDSDGTIHVVYTDSNAIGDLYYIKRKAEQTDFSAPVKVNSTPRCAAAFNMAVGKEGRVHVLIRPNAVYSKTKLQRQPKFNDLKFMLYCRLDDSDTRFEEERDLAGGTFAFEGVGAIIADARGTVFAFWHGLAKPGPEQTRRIFRSRSEDEGKTFSAPTAVQLDPIGTCACCSMQGTLGKDGQVYLAYRNSEESGTKDSYLLTSSDGGRTFRSRMLEPWPDAGCPGSFYTLVPGASKVYVAWNTMGQVSFAKADDPRPISPSSANRECRAPVLAVNWKGQVLFAWSEAENARQFMNGGDLAWQVFDSAGKALSEKKVIAGGVARWSMPAAYAKPNGDFVILHDGPGTK